MLAVQVQYWSLQEDKRHNRATEYETNRHNVSVETETHRHNVETELLGNRSLNETIRHNVATESYWNRSLNETIRHNRETEAVGWYNAGSQRISANAALLSANANVRNAETNFQRMRNDYALGLQANNISLFNAQTQDRLATVQEKRLAVDTDRYNAEIAQGWATIMNNQARTNIQQSELELNQQRFEHSKRMDVWRNINDSVDVGRKVADTVASFVSGSTSKGSQAVDSARSAWHSFVESTANNPRYYDEYGMPLTQ